MHIRFIVRIETDTRRTKIKDFARHKGSLTCQHTNLKRRITTNANAGYIELFEELIFKT